MKAIRINVGADGFYYLDVREAGCASFKPASRHATLDEVMQRAKEVLCLEGVAA